MVLSHARNYQNKKEKFLSYIERIVIKRIHRSSNLSSGQTIRYDFLERLIDETCRSTGNFSVSDWHQFIRKITYKAEWYGKEVRFISLSAKECQK